MLLGDIRSVKQFTPQVTSNLIPVPEPLYRVMLKTIPSGFPQSSGNSTEAARIPGSLTWFNLFKGRSHYYENHRPHRWNELGVHPNLLSVDQPESPGRAGRAALSTTGSLQCGFCRDR